MSFSRQFTLSSPTGASLNVCAQDAAGAPRGVIQINHGLAEHGARYARFAGFMAARGFSVYAHDHRGHGATTAPDSPPRVFSSGDDGAARVVADVAAVHSLIAEENPGLPVIVFGHSMGGLIALDYVLRHPGRVRAAAIWNANISAGLPGRAARAILAWERLRLGSDVPSRILPRLTFRAWARQVPERRTEFDWLSRDPDEVDRYVADPLCGWDATVGMWRALFDFIFFAADDASFAPLPKDIPIKLVGGAKDPATGGGKAVKALESRMRRMGFSNLSSTVYADTRHESLNEVNRDMIMAEFADWAEASCGIDSQSGRIDAR